MRMLGQGSGADKVECMESELRGRTAFVTGAGRGIGRSVAIAFAERGANVAIAARTRSDVEATAEKCRKFGVKAVSFELDVSRRESCDQAVKACEDELGEIDILVNNAGVSLGIKFLDVDDATWEQTLAVNLSGPFYVTRAALPGMLRRESGAVIAVNSIAGRVGAAYMTPYGASKHGLIGLMRCLSVEYARSGITFNCVCPGYVDTPMTEQTIANVMQKTGRTREQALQPLLTPQGRLVLPEEVAAVCVLLASESGRSINGQAINVDGGLVQS